MSKTVKCPRWGCDGVGIPVDTKKKFSFGKAIVGNTVGGLFGPVGAIVGTATGINGKNGENNFCVFKMWEGIREENLVVCFSLFDSFIIRYIRHKISNNI